MPDTVPRPDGETLPAPGGLSTAEAARRLAQHGPNEVARERPHALLAFARRFWGPVPWMLEATVALQLLLGKHDEAAVIALLVLVNAVLGGVQEGRANRALALLRGRLHVQARVLRDGRWRLLPAHDLVPGDLVHIRMGDLVPADLRLVDGRVQLDASTLTGESLPVEAPPGSPAFSGSVVTRGEASGEVTATGTRTRFGQTAELVRSAAAVSHLETTILSIVRHLVALDLALVAALVVYALVTHLPWAEVLPFTLILLVASVPVALPATFTLATALGSVELARRGVLVTRLAAIEEAAAMDVLASDKTGTITQNRLGVAALAPLPGTSEDELLRLAALACDDATQDPIDVAILEAARSRPPSAKLPRRTGFVPFDPSTRRTEATFEAEGGTQRAIKGAAADIARLCGAADVDGTIKALAAEGRRVLGVAHEQGGTLRLRGFIGLEDPARPDAAALIRRLQDLGIRVLMVTGDAQPTALAVARAVGIGERACPAATLSNTATADAVGRCDVFAGAYPEDKFRLVQALQAGGHVMGMTGDGVNDAPALRQAEVGIAVANATDVAKAAASLVLTNAGLGDIIEAVETSRRIYQRMLTYTLNKIIKTLEIAVFMSLGVMLTRTFVITPLLIVLLLFTNDFVTMAIATDRVDPAPQPQRWRVGAMLRMAVPLAALVLVLSFSVFFLGRNLLHLPLPQLQTLIFVMLVFTGLGNVFLVRERGHLWKSRPSTWLMAASLIDVAIVCTLATQGILMAPVAPALIAALGALVVVYLLAMDFLKVAILRHLVPPRGAAPLRRD